MVRKRTRACGPVFARVACTHHVDALRRALVGNPSHCAADRRSRRRGRVPTGPAPIHGGARLAGPGARPRRPGDHPRPAAERPRVVPADRRLARRLRGDRACALRAPLRPEHPPGHGVTNPLGLGFESQAMVGVRTTGPPENVADVLVHWEEADYVVVTTGRFDLLVEVVCADRRALLDVTNRIRSLPRSSPRRPSSTSSSGSSSTTGAPATASSRTLSERRLDGARRPARRRRQGVRRRPSGRPRLARDPAGLVLRTARPVGAARRRRSG